MISSRNKQIKCDGFNANVIRTQRKKTISIKIKADKVSIIVPSDLSTAHIKVLLIKKTAWIQKKLKDQSQIESIKAKKYISGELFCFLGNEYPLTIKQAKSPSVALNNNDLTVALPNVLACDNTAQKIKEMLSIWYQNEASKILKEKVAYYAKLIAVQPTAIEIKTYKARWGSCTIHAKVQFNWKLIMAPHRVIDYVVVHELCHIIEHNHSPAFWHQVEKFMPDYRESKQWLKLNGIYLELS